MGWFRNRGRGRHYWVEQVVSVSIQFGPRTRRWCEGGQKNAEPALQAARPAGRIAPAGSDRGNHRSHGVSHVLEQLRGQQPGVRLGWVPDAPGGEAWGWSFVRRLEDDGNVKGRWWLMSSFVLNLPENCEQRCHHVDCHALHGHRLHILSVQEPSTTGLQIHTWSVWGRPAYRLDLMNLLPQCDPLIVPHWWCLIITFVILDLFRYCRVIHCVLQLCV